MNASTRPSTPDPRALARAVEDLRGPFHALQMAQAGIAAGMRIATASDDGVYFLLQAVADQFDNAIAKLEALMGTRP